MKLSFMTWICPNWDIEQIIAEAKKYGYAGVEIRTEEKHKHNLEFTSDISFRKKVRNEFKKNNLEISCISTSLSFSVHDKETRNNNLNKLKEYIKLCSDVGCKYIRVFGKFPPGIKEKEYQSFHLNDIINDLSSVADCAITNRVEILIETHPETSLGKTVAEIIAGINSPGINILWDMMHPFVYGESPEDTYKFIKKNVRHLHFHDYVYNSQIKEDNLYASWKPVPLGQGNLPVREIIEILKDDEFQGYLSVEVFEGDPGEVLYQYAETFKKL